ncbi:bifunctional diaminohydroxyphosphoribosylaminopyrimidine deaminase/5-amino-6-(5-phosphoribosylamino)uracil reductase RibD [Buchnera aphidicola (Aphis craccivora)]|nr:bifunctional diaminohydroxyphosphoribosylaminopyrimidine deaminase/5-amino-6-(5-phosphoribosylamino)uracil reductase RibD [Buchnera aphidicola (Aphis craccivora)]
MSIDGRIAMKTGESKWITSQDSRQDVQVFRAKSSAILSTSKTIINDNAQLTVRKEEFNKKILSQFPEKNFKHPIRVIIDSQNRINKSHKIMNTKEKILLIRLKQDDELWPDNVKQIIIKPYKKKINVLSTLKFLGELEINTVWIEAGSKLSGALLKMKLIDEIIIYIAPKILGHEAKPLFFLKNNLKLFECIKFNFLNLKKIGPDIRLILEPQK